MGEVVKGSRGVCLVVLFARKEWLFFTLDCVEKRFAPLRSRDWSAVVASTHSILKWREKTLHDMGEQEYMTVLACRTEREEVKKSGKTA